MGESTSPAAEVKPPTEIPPNWHAHTPWRQPGVESDDLYPGLSVHDSRVTGSIVVDHSRLPLWAFVWNAVNEGWEEVERGYSPTEHYGYTANDLGRFLYNLLEQRGEFGRLLLVLADAEAHDRGDRPWWETKRHRRRVADQLRLCLAKLEAQLPKRGA